MKQLPETARPYKRTPVFTEDTIPAGLLKDHSTKEGVWGLIVIEAGTLHYTIGADETHTLTQANPGVVEPEVLHHIAPKGPVRFYVEFYR